jgi:hypothetical protein
MQKYFRLVEDVSMEMANIVFDKAARKVIKDTVKHIHLVSTSLCYSHVLYHSLYLKTNFYLIITFVVLLAGAKVADKATLGARHLSDQEATA